MTARLAIAAVGLLLLGASGTGSARDVAERWAVALASGSGAEVANQPPFCVIVS